MEECEDGLWLHFLLVKVTIKLEIAICTRLFSVRTVTTVFKGLKSPHRSVAVMNECSMQSRILPPPRKSMLHFSCMSVERHLEGTGCRVLAALGSKLLQSGKNIEPRIYITSGISTRNFTIGLS